MRVITGLLLLIGLSACGTRQPDADGDGAQRGGVVAATPAPVGEPGASLPTGSWFTEITDTVGLHLDHDAGVEGDYRFEELAAPGCAIVDFDGDGLLDIYVTNGGTQHRRGDALDPAKHPPMDRLYRRQPDGTFADVTEQAGMAATRYGMGCAVGDYDNDGDPDLFVTNFGLDQLWRNNSDGTMTDVTVESGISNELWSVASAFLDYDRDGLLDLFVSNYVLDPNGASCYDVSGALDYCGPDSFLPSSDKLYHNEGGGRFRDVSVESGIALAPGPGLGAVCADFNDDGWDDVYVANDGERNFLWINRHDGTFRESATLAGCAFNRDGSAEAGMGIALGDVDLDGRLDLFVTHLVNQSNTLYLGSPSASFVDATDRRGLGMSSVGWTGFGTGFVDFDHDGDQDLLVANGAVKRRSRMVAGAVADEHWLLYAEPNLLYLNDGKGHFENISELMGPICSRPEVSRGLAFGDFDSDGDLDVLMTQVDGPIRLFRNDVPKLGRWLVVRTLDPALKRDALGAVVTVTAGGRTQHRTVTASFSYASSSQPVAHFGLGEVASIDEVTVRWPDGAAERFAGVPIDTAVELRRGEGTRVSRP